MIRENERVRQTLRVNVRSSLMRSLMVENINITTTTPIIANGPSAACSNEYLPPGIRSSSEMKKEYDMGSKSKTTHDTIVSTAKRRIIITK